jgi:hypothetical protein
MTALLLESIITMGKDIRKAAITLDKKEVRFLVDSYYERQDERIRSAGRERALDKEGEPNAIVSWLTDQAETLENQIKGALEKYAKSDPTGEWAMSQWGIGPVITAGLLSHIDIEKANTSSKVWAYAGVDANRAPRKKGEKINYNPTLKTLVWKIGESFVMGCNNEKAFYPQIYVKRKAYETRKNEAGEYAAQAANALATKNYSKDTEAYKAYIQGKLPLGQIHARAKRYAAKMFLSHFHHVLYMNTYGKPPEKIYPIAILGHADFIEPPKFIVPQSLAA